MSPLLSSPIANHLWQSTLFGVAVWLLSLLFRRAPAHVRYRLWMAGSVKFLAPFSLFLTAAAWFDRHSVSAAPIPAAAAIQRLSAPFAPVREVPAVVLAPSHLWPAILAVWLAGFIFAGARMRARWSGVRAAMRGAIRLPIAGPVPVMASRARLEPGVFGLLRPVLLLPAGIEGRLTPGQFRSVLAHEFCHVRRRDNLSAALHMAVEAIFWFHPLVWWISARLVEERERACDEEVLRSGGDPGEYAAGILGVCRHYLESPLLCAPGVTGAELRGRIEQIMRHRRAKSLSRGHRVLLSAASVAALALPVLLGIIGQGKAQTGTPPRFEVASIKPTKDGALKYGLSFLPGGGLKMDGVTLKGLISFAYAVTEEHISGGPRWIGTEAYDVLAKAEKPDPGDTDTQVTTAAPGTPVWNRVRLRTQVLLKERFQLAIHFETSEKTGYSLVVAKGGPKLKVSTSQNPPSTMRSMGRITARGGSIGMLATVLQNFLGRPVADQTGLSGTYDYTLTYEQETPGEIGGDTVGPSVTTALKEQLGLALEKAKVEVKQIVVDAAEKASAN